MALIAPQASDCDNNALFALREGSANPQPQDWPWFNCDFDCLPIVLPTTPNQASFGQNETFTYAGGRSDSLKVCDFVREASIPLDQLRNEVLWPVPQPDAPGPRQPETEYRITRDTLGPAGDQLDLLVNVEPVKQKRGRPRLEPPYLNPQKPSACTRQDQAARKSQLEKNRIAADKCRRQRKVHTSKLVAQHANLAAKNEALKADLNSLREELLDLKHEVLQHANCGAWMIDSYVARIAGDLCHGGVSVAVTRGSSNSVETLCSNPGSDVTDSTGADDISRSESGDSTGNIGLALDDSEVWFLNYDRALEGQ